MLKKQSASSCLHHHAFGVSYTPQPFPVSATPQVTETRRDGDGEEATAETRKGRKERRTPTEQGSRRVEWRNRRGSAAARPTLTRDGFLKIYRETTERESENITNGVGESTGGTLVEGDRTWGGRR